MAALSRRYQVKDMGKPHQFLGMKVKLVADDTVLLSQESYIEEVLHRFAIEATRSTQLPMVANIHLDFTDDGTTDDERAYMVKMPYRQAVGAILYLARVTRPDILFTVGQLTRHASAPQKMAWDAAKYLFRHLRATTVLKMKFQPTRDDIVVATDADWANGRVGRKSVSGSVVYLFGCPVAWASKKQTIVAKSSTDAEYISANNGIEDALMVQAIANESASNKHLQRSEHSEIQKTVDVKYHAVKDLIHKGELTAGYTPTGEMTADLLTKVLVRTEFRRKRSMCSLVDTMV
ncbi:hypothetical protein PHMEG_00040985, partial [Phytophthora megakarya]